MYGLVCLPHSFQDSEAQQLKGSPLGGEVSKYAYAVGHEESHGLVFAEKHRNTAKASGGQA